MVARLKKYKWFMVAIVGVLVALGGAMQFGLVSPSLGDQLSLDVASTGTPSLSNASPELAPALIYNSVTGAFGIEWFMRGSDNQIWGRRATRTGWAWESLQGGLDSAPATTDNGSWVFAKAGDQAIWYRHRSAQDGAWDGWLSLGGQWTAAPAVTYYKSDVYVFARGTDNKFQYRAHSNGVWSGWAQMGGGTFTSAPAAIYVPTADQLYVFGKGTDNALYYKKYSGGSWSDWQGLGGILTSGPTAALSSYYDVYRDRTVDDLYVIARGTDNALWYRIKRWGGTGFEDWRQIPDGWFSSGPGAVSSDNYGNIDVYGRGLDNRVYRIHGMRTTYDRWGTWSVAP